MHATTRWPAEGLRWIGSFFAAAADRLQRASIAAQPCEPLPPEHCHDADRIDDIRRRIHSRYF